MNDQPCRLDRGGESGVLGQEAIARMQRARARRVRGLENGGDVQIALGRRGPANAERDICLGHEGRIAVGFGKDRHALQPQLAAGPLDAPRNLAPVGDQDTIEAHFTRHEGTPLPRKLLIPSMPSGVSQASASRSAV